MQNSVTSPVPLTRAMPARAMWGVFVRKERGSHSWRGRLVVASAVLLLGALVLRDVYPFLAITHRVNANILVVKGWIHEYVTRAAVKEFQSSHYQRIFTTSASVGADLLKKCGLSKGRLQKVPFRVMGRDRTYWPAVALRNWFRDHDMGVYSSDVVTEDLQARRTRLFFQKPFGKNVRIGIIAIPNMDYPLKRWWDYDQGLKHAVSKFAAYLHAKPLFFPSAPIHPRKAVWLSSVNNRKVKIAVVGLGCVGYHSPSNLRDLCVNGLGIDLDPRKLPKPLNKNRGPPKAVAKPTYASTARSVVASCSRECTVISGPPGFGRIVRLTLVLSLFLRTYNCPQL